MGETSEELSNQTMSFLQAGTLLAAPLDGVSLVGSGFCVELESRVWRAFLVFFWSVLAGSSKRKTSKEKGKGKGVQKAIN